MTVPGAVPHLGAGLELARIRDARPARVSSFDQRGRNQDGWVIGPGETRVLADLEGPGSITHFFMTQFCRRTLGPGLLDPTGLATSAPVVEMHNALGMNWEIADPDYYRKVLLRITWDDDPNPAVLVPLGDFFGVGHSMPANYASALFSVSAKPEEALHFGGSAALNTYVPMPFRRRALIEVVNENDVAYTQYFHIDYELYRQPLPDDVAYFHARWRRDDPCDGWGPDIQVNSPEVNVVNLDGARNFVVLDTQGTGHYIGCNLSVFHRQGTWWGEGDDMIFIDDDTWPPSFHGTGTEDYFLHAWGMQRDNAYPYGGSILHEADLPGYAVAYRLHVVDPLHFRSRIRVTIEHGHGNHLSDDWAATAYWYQLPPSPAASILPVELRLPHRAEPPAAVPAAAASRRAEEETARFREAYEERRRRYLDARAETTAERIALTEAWEHGNREAARNLRGRTR
jgi:D-arabinan exo alpha-(1,3)/(1,5)-arabinofuranosidase (non-reducing end)